MTNGTKVSWPKLKHQVRHLLQKRFESLFFLGALGPSLALTLYLFSILNNVQKTEFFFIAIPCLLLTLAFLKTLISLFITQVARKQKEENALYLAQIEAINGQTQQKKLEELQNSILEIRRGYEHQIDLLQTSVAKSRQEVTELNFEMEGKLEEIRKAYFAFEDLRKEYMRLEEEHKGQTAQFNEKWNHQERLLADYQQTVHEQRSVIEKKQTSIDKLQSRVEELHLEVRSLLQLEEPPSDPNIAVDLALEASSLAEFYLPSETRTAKPYDIATQLEHYIQEAQRITGAGHLGYLGGKSPRFLETSQSLYEIDLRRLFDLLKDEKGGIIFVICSSEKRFLFVNNMVRDLLGVAPEKFMKEFADMMVSGFDQWNQALLELNGWKESQTRIIFRNKKGEKIPCTSYMGKIVKGPFANHIIGICAPI